MINISKRLIFLLGIKHVIFTIDTKFKLNECNEFILTFSCFELALVIF